MVAVLLMVGRHQEQPSVITRLLDINATPAKPCYTMAPEVRHAHSTPARLMQRSQLQQRRFHKCCRRRHIAGAAAALRLRVPRGAPLHPRRPPAA